MDAEQLEEAIRDSLISANAWLGGAVGVAESDEVFVTMEAMGLIGPRWGLTRKGLACAVKAQREYWGD